MTNYHLKPPENSLPYSTWREAKEKRKKLLESVRQRRAERYQRILQKMRIATRRHFVYTTLIMSDNLTSIDIRHLKLSDLVRLVEEVKATKTPRILKRDQEPMAMLMPMGTAIQRSHPHKRNIWTHYDPQRVRAALKQSAGALQEVDREELLSDLASQRSQESSGRTF